MEGTVCHVQSSHGSRPLNWFSVMSCAFLQLEGATQMSRYDPYNPEATDHLKFGILPGPDYRAFDSCTFSGLERWALKTVNLIGLAAPSILGHGNLRSCSSI